MLNKWLHEPLLHFLLIGAVLFVVYELQNDGRIDNNRIVIGEAEINHLLALWQKKRQRLPTQEELQGLIDQQVREEIMYREALAMGLDQNDPVVRRRLAQKVEFISSDLAALVEPADSELEAYLAKHSEKFELPARINFTQVYINPDKHGADTEDHAKHLLTKLMQTHVDTEAGISSIGDPIMLDQQYEQMSEHGVSRLFGNDFADKLFTLPVGNWQGPVNSGYGLHLVWIDSKTPARQRELAEVHDKVRNEWLAQQRRIMDRSFYQGLRERYEVIVKTPAEKDLLASSKQ